MKFKAGSGFDGECVIEIKTISGTGRTKAVLMIDIDEEPSVTNNAAEIATEAVAQYDLDPGRTIWIEHYPEVIDRTTERIGREGSYDLVTFTWEKGIARHPDWSHMPVACVMQLLRIGPAKEHQGV